MTDTSGPTSLWPAAHYAPAGSSSKTWQVMSLWGWTPFSETLPRWGMTRRGVLYELPTPAPPTSASDCSSLLPTPTATESGGARQVPQVRTHDGQDFGPRLKDLAVTLLPTPTAAPYGNNQSPSPGAAVRPSLDSLAPTLLPTPTAMDSKASGGSSTANVTLTDAVVRTSLGAHTSLDDTADPA